MAKKKTVATEEIVAEAVVEEEVKKDEELTLEDFTQEELERANVADADLSDDTNEDDDIEIPLYEEEPPADVEDEIPEPEVKKSKVDTMSEEQLRKSYVNIEKVVGRLGQELGELRKAKTTEEPKTPEEKIRAMSDKELEESIGFFKSEILKPNAAIEDDDFAQKNILYNDLKEERTLRIISKEQNSKSAKTNNKPIIQDFSATWKEALGDDFESVVELAESKLSDKNGYITKDDLEVALHKVNPTLYRNAIKLTAAKEEKDRIVQAQTKKQPRISASGNGIATQPTITISKLKQMDAVELQDLLDTLPYETVLKIEKELQR